MPNEPAVSDQQGTLKIDEPLASRMARALVGNTLQDMPTEVVGKVKVCLLDYLGCVFQSRDLPWSRQALRLAPLEKDGAVVIGYPQTSSSTDAAFANAVMGHGLVREDMHSGSISHLGIVVLPTLLSLVHTRPRSGREFIMAAVVGYEAGAKIGRAAMDPTLARIHRPTGITGPIAGAAAGARLLGLSIGQTVSAIALGANCTAGFNQWAHTGGSEMFFHAGFAARNAVTAVRLAESGAFASPSALDGVAGLFSALGKPAASAKVRLFQGAPEILSVYHKPVPACNFAQTPCQAALKIARDSRIPPERIASITIRVPRAGAVYPGCDSLGPFDHILQAKMSIQYNVAAALLMGDITEENFTLLKDARMHRLMGKMTLEIDEPMTQAYPGKQGGAVEVRDVDGAIQREYLDDVVNASVSEVRARFRGAAADAMGAQRAQAIEEFVDALEESRDVGRLGVLLRASGS